VSDFEIPEDLLYSSEDEWARREGSERVVIGITDYAQQQLGEIVHVELPEVGVRIERGDEFGSIDSVKAVAELYAPVSGEVIEANEALVENPELINEDCYGDGWIAVVRTDREDEDAQLLRAAAYRKLVADRSD
jgi:glycine cleavage system H protein